MSPQDPSLDARLEAEIEDFLREQRRQDRKVIRDRLLVLLAIGLFGSLSWFFATPWGQRPFVTACLGLSFVFHCVAAWELFGNERFSVAARWLVVGTFAKVVLPTLFSGRTESVGTWTAGIVVMVAGSVLNERETKLWMVAILLFFGLLVVLPDSNIPPEVVTNELFDVGLKPWFAGSMGIVAYMVAKSYQNKTDATDTMQQRLIEDYEQACEDDRCKTAFLAKMSHELRTPMNGLLGMTQHLMHMPTDAKSLRTLRGIYHSAQSLQVSLDEALELSKGSDGGMALRMQSMDLQALMLGVETLFSTQAKHFNTRFEFQLPPEPVWVAGDEARIRQIVHCLVGNALKFGGGDLIEVSLDCSGDTEKDDDSCKYMVSIRVRDQGPGMSPELQKRLARDFDQVIQGRELPRGHNGMSLAIAQGWIHKMGGTLRFLSAKGEGTVFIVRIPMAPVWQQIPPSVPSQAKTAQGFRMRKGTRVLVVDDNPINLRVAKLWLKRYGCETVVAEDGEIAVLKTKEQSFDLILMDLRMPNMDGYQATRQILAEASKTQAPPIVAFTANVFSEDRNRALEAGMVDVLAKPFKTEKLREILSKHVARGLEGEPSRGDFEATLAQSA